MRLFLLLLLFVSIGEAATIVSERLNLIAQDGKLYQNKTLTVQCSRSDFGTPVNLTITNSVTNVTSYVIINCSSPRITYLGGTSPQAYIPRDGRLQSMEYCMSRDFFRYESSVPSINLTDAESASSSWGGGGLSLQSHNPDHHWSLKMQPREPEPHFDHFTFKQRYRINNRLLRALDNKQLWHPPGHHFTKHAPPIAGLSRLTIGLIGFTGGVVGGFFGGIAGAQLYRGGGGVPQAALDNLRADTYNMVDTLNKSIQATQQWQSNITGIVTNLTLAYEDSKVVFNQTLAAFKNQNDTFEQYRQIYERSSSAIDNEILATRQRMTDVDTSVSDLADAVATLTGAQNQTLQYAMNFTKDGLINVNTSLWSIRDALIERMTNNDARIRSLTTTVNRLTGSVREAIVKLQTLRGLTRLAQLSLYDLANEGSYSPFLSDVGQQPADSLGFYRSILIDSVRTHYGWTNGGNYYLRASMFVLDCDITAVLSRLEDFMTWRDLMDHMGPIGCNKSVIGDCSCWVTVQSSYCTSNQSMVESSLVNNTRFLVLNSTYCTSSVTYDANQTFYNGEDLLNYLGTKCTDEPILAGTYSVISSTVFAMSHYMAQDNAVCDMITTVVFQSTANYVWSIFYFWELGYGEAMRKKDIYSHYLDGLIPNNMTIVEEPFVRRDSVDMSCWTAYYMAYSTDWLPVYRYINPVINTSVSVAVNGTTVLTTSDVLVATPTNFILEAELRVAGNPVSTTSVYDIPENELSLTPTAQSRQGKPTYAMVPCEACNNLTYWRSINGIAFDHRFGNTMPEYFKRNVSSNFCNGTSKSGEGSWCTRKDNFFFYLNGSALVAEPYSATYLVTVIVPEGQVTANQFSECPVVSIDPMSGSWVQVHLFNPTGQSIRVAVVETGACTRSFLDVNIGSGKTYEHLVPTCTTGSGQVALTVSRYIGSELTECVNITGLNVTVDRTNLIELRAVPDTRYVNERSATEVDITGLNLYKTDRSLLEFLANLVVTNYAAMQSISVTVPNEVYLNYSSLLAQLKNISNTTAERLLNDTLRAAFNLTNITQPYLDKVSQNQAELNAIIGIFEGALFNFSGRIVNATDVIALLNQSLSNAVYWQNQLVVAVANFSNSLLDFAGNVSYALRNRGGLFNDLLYGLGNALEDAANGVVNIGEDGIDWVTDVAKKIYEVGKKASEGFWSALSSPFGIISAVGTLVSYIIFMCIGVMACYFCYRNRKRLKKLAASKKDDTPKPKPAPPPVPVPAKPTAAVTAKPAAVAPAPTVAKTAASTDIKIAVETSDNERSSLLSKPSYTRQHVQFDTSSSEEEDDEDF